MKNRKKILLILFSMFISSLFVACGQTETPVGSTEVSTETDDTTKEDDESFDPEAMIDMGEKVPLPIKPETESFDYSLFSDEKAISNIISIEFIDEDSTVREFSFSKFTNPEAEMCFYNHTKTDRTPIDAAEMSLSFDEIVSYMQKNVKTLPNPAFFDYVPLRTIEDISQYAAEKEKLSVIIMLYIHLEDEASQPAEDSEGISSAIFKYYGLVKGQEMPANLKTLENFLMKKLEESKEAATLTEPEEETAPEQPKATTTKKKKKK